MPETSSSGDLGTSRPAMNRRKRIGNHVGLDAEVDQPMWRTRSLYLVWRVV